MSRVTCSPCRGVYPMLALALVAASGAHIMGTADEVGPSPVAGLKVGHHTLDTRPTGCTVILAEGGAVAGVDVRGAAPGTRETDLLNPLNLVEQVHAIVLAGGSAFGLDAASGVMRYLEETQHRLPHRLRPRAHRARGDPVRPRRRQSEDPPGRRLRLRGGRGGFGGPDRRRAMSAPAPAPRWANCWAWIAR